MAVIGAAVGGLIGGFGKKPKIPQLPDIDPNKVQAETTAGNLQNFPDIQKLTRQVNEFNLDQVLSSLDMALPGQRQQANEIVSSQLRGEIPQDVSEAIQRTAAETAFAGGFAGSGMQRGLTLRDLGLTSLQIQQQGLSNFGSMASITKAPMFDPTSMFFSPQQRLSFELEDRSQRFQRDLLKAQVKAAPDPFAAAMTQAIIQDEAAIMQMVGDAVGMMGAMCWVARSVYGIEDIRWRLFRIWMLRDAPKWLLKIYLKYGERFSKVLEWNKSLKLFIRKLMDPIVKKVGRQYGIIN